MLRSFSIIMLLFFMIFPNSLKAQEPEQNLSLSQENAKIFNKGSRSHLKAPTISKEHLTYIVSMGIGFQSFYYFENQEYKNKGSENFLRLSLNTSYYLFNFLSFTINTGVLFLPSYSNVGINNEYKPYFPNTVSRIGVFLTPQVELNVHSFKDSMFYFLLGGEYIYLAPLTNTNTSSSSVYPDSTKHYMNIKLGIGNRFALFSHTVTDISFFVSLPLAKKTSLTGKGDIKYKNIVIGFDFSFGYFN